MRIGVAATPDVALPTLDWLLASKHELLRVITQPDRPSGRGQAIKASLVSQWANQHGVELVKPLAIEELNGALADLDLLITIGFGRLLPEQTFSIPTFGAINLHFSLLPHYRGAAPVQRAIEAGEIRSGVTVFKLDSGMDTGPIYSSHSVDIDQSDRSFELLQRLSQIGVVAICQALDSIEAAIAPVAQAGTSSRAMKISKEEAQINWNSPSHIIVNKIRGFYPQPCAWTVFRGAPLKIAQSKISQETLALAPGELRVFNAKVLIGTSDLPLELELVIPAGKSEMNAMDWSRGARFADGERCG